MAAKRSGGRGRHLVAMILMVCLPLLARPAVAIQVATELRVADSGAWSIDVTRDVALAGDWVEQAADIQRLDPEHVLFVSGRTADGFVVAAVDGSGWKKVGRSGQGPGEYRFIRWVVPHDGRLHVFDGAAMRRTVLDARFEVVRTNPFQINSAGGAAILDDSTYIVNGSIPARDRVGHVLHHFGPEGEVIRSFDESPDGYGTSSSGNTQYRSLSATSAGSLWAAHRTRYQIDLWDVESGARTLSLLRKADWFTPHSEWSSNDPAMPSKAQLLDLEVDSAGRLWVLIAVASRRWSEGFVRAREGAHPELGAFVLEDWNIAYDTVVEVIDPNARCVLATVTLDDRVPFFVGPGWAASYREDEQGNPMQQLWRLRLDGPPSQSTGEAGCEYSPGIAAHR